MTRGPGAGYDAVILAGGAARRLGGLDKPAQRVGGRSMLARVAGAVRDAGRIVVVGPPRPVGVPVVWVGEDPPGSGPVPALATGLRRVAAPQVAVLAADLPFLRAADVALLRARARGRRGAVFVDDGGAAQWLAGVWSTAHLRAALARTADPRGSLRSVLAPLEPERVRPVDRADRPPPWYDCDTVTSLNDARRDATVLTEWVDAVCAELGLDPAEVDRGLVLDLARDVAHGVARPAAPLTAYLMGLAVGQGAAARDVAARLVAMAQGWTALDGTEPPSRA